MGIEHKSKLLCVSLKIHLYTKKVSQNGELYSSLLCDESGAFMGVKGGFLQSIL